MVVQILRQTVNVEEQALFKTVQSSSTCSVLKRKKKKNPQARIVSAGFIQLQKDKTRKKKKKKNKNGKRQEM